MKKNLNAKSLVAYEALLLNCLKNKDGYGYALANQIHKKFDIDINYSTLYTILNNLERNGYIVGRWVLEVVTEKNRKIYNLTNKGVNSLKLLTEKLNNIIKKLNET